MKFSLLHPSRSRPNKSISTTRQWLDTCKTHDVELIVSIDENDHYKADYLFAYEDIHKAKVIVNHNRSAVDAINNAAKQATGDVFIVVSDDTGFIRNWDEIIQRAVSGRKDFVLKTFDGVQKWLVTMPILDRVYYDRFGYIYNSSYFHQFCDTEFTHVADVTDRIIWRNDIEIKHLHYSVLKQKKDSLYERNDATFNDGKRIYLQRFRQAFGLNGIDVWNIHGESHLEWLKRAI